MNEPFNKDPRIGIGFTHSPFSSLKPRKHSAQASRWDDLSQRLQPGTEQRRQNPLASSGTVWAKLVWLFSTPQSEVLTHLKLQCSAAPVSSAKSGQASGHKSAVSISVACLAWKQPLSAGNLGSWTEGAPLATTSRFFQAIGSGLYFEGSGQS